jgi:hypothetical protein
MLKDKEGNNFDLYLISNLIPRILQIASSFVRVHCNTDVERPKYYQCMKSL